MVSESEVTSYVLNYDSVKTFSAQVNLYLKLKHWHIKNLAQWANSTDKIDRTLECWIGFERHVNTQVNCQSAMGDE